MPFSLPNELETDGVWLRVAAWGGAAASGRSHAIWILIKLAGHDLPLQGE